MHTHTRTHICLTRRCMWLSWGIFLMQLVVAAGENLMQHSFALHCTALLPRLAAVLKCQAMDLLYVVTLAPMHHRTHLSQ